MENNNNMDGRIALFNLTGILKICVVEMKSFLKGGGKLPPLFFSELVTICHQLSYLQFVDNCSQNGNL